MSKLWAIWDIEKNCYYQTEVEVDFISERCIRVVAVFASFSRVKKFFRKFGLEKDRYKPVPVTLTIKED